MSSIIIREMEKQDWPSVKSIYESGIQTGVATFETSVPDWEQWDETHLKLGRLVAVEEGSVIGWTALSPVSSRCIYGGVAEISVYVAPDNRGKRVGKKLLKELLPRSEEMGIWTLQSSVFKENVASQKLHLSIGFRMIGYRERIGQLHGVWRDNVLFERRSQWVGH